MSIPGTGISNVEESKNTSGNNKIPEETTEKPDSSGCCYFVIAFPVFLVICLLISTLNIYLALIVGIAFVIAAYCFFITKQAKENDAESEPALVSKTSPVENESISACIIELKESAELVNNTVHPDVFFRRLKFIIETLMHLQQYEDRYDFGVSTPTNDLNRVLLNMEQTVRDFTTRTYSKQLLSAAELKTERGRNARMQKCFTEMEASFLKSDSYWSGDSLRPHYNGKLYTDTNMEELRQIYEAPIDWENIHLQDKT